jgi:CRP/FNR family transcriptional regulator
MFQLNKISMFNTLSDSDVKEVRKYLITENFRKKEFIFAEGDPPDWLYIVVQGKVKITRISHEGKEIILEIIPPMDIFGAVAVIRGFPYPANAVAMEDTQVIKISKSHLMAILDRFPSAMYCMVQSLGDRIRGSHDTLKSIALEKVSSRIASLLLKLSEQTGKDAAGGIAIDLRLTKQDIAEMVGTTVETAIRTMSRFKKQGVIAERAGRIIIKDPERLKSLTTPQPSREE